MEQQTQHPNYYNRYSVEVVEMARRIWGGDEGCWRNHSIYLQNACGR